MNALWPGGGEGLEAQLYSLFNLGARWEWGQRYAQRFTPGKLYILDTQIRQITTD